MDVDMGTTSTARMSMTVGMAMHGYDLKHVHERERGREREHCQGDSQLDEWAFYVALLVMAVTAIAQATRSRAWISHRDPSLTETLPSRPCTVVPRSASAHSALAKPPGVVVLHVYAARRSAREGRGGDERTRPAWSCCITRTRCLTQPLP